MPKHLLVVAADQHLRAVLAQTLTTAGYTVLTVGSAHDALQVAVLDPFDVILVAPAPLAAHPDLAQHLRALGVTATVLLIPATLVQRAAAVVPVASAQHPEQPFRQRVGQLPVRRRLWSAGGRLDGWSAARLARQAAAVSKTNQPIVAARPGPAQDGEPSRDAPARRGASVGTAADAAAPIESGPDAVLPRAGQCVDALV